MNSNVFEHDATPTWSGFLYQGRIAVYLAVKKLCELQARDEIGKVPDYKIEMEKCEDVAIVKETKGTSEYLSIHQMKNKAGTALSDYKDALVQLMLEKGFYGGNPEAWLHVSTDISGANAQSVATRISSWKDECKKCYDELKALQTGFGGTKGDVEKVLSATTSMGKVIGINRAEYQKMIKYQKKCCEAVLDKFQKNQSVDPGEINEIKDILKNFIDYLEKELYIQQINEKVALYDYDGGNLYCPGPESYDKILKLVKDYKQSTITDEQCEHLTDRLINFCEKKILMRHNQAQQRQQTASVERIGLQEFLNLMDTYVEAGEKEANILALRRLYNDQIMQFCETCVGANGGCLKQECNLKNVEYHYASTLDADEFVKHCYHLNPECFYGIVQRECIGKLFNGDGMNETYLRVLQEVSRDHFTDLGDKIHLKVKNDQKTAYVTSISSKNPESVVKNIKRTMKNEGTSELIELIFQADQLVTAELDAPDPWDHNYFVIGPQRVTGVPGGNRKNSIIAPKYPELVKAEDIIQKYKP